VGVVFSCVGCVNMPHWFVAFVGARFEATTEIGISGMTTYELWRENTDKTKPPTPLIKSNKKADIDSAISLLKKDSLGHGLYIREGHYHTDGTFHKAVHSQFFYPRGPYNV